MHWLAIKNLENTRCMSLRDGIRRSDFLREGGVPWWGPSKRQTTVFKDSKRFYLVFRSACLGGCRIQLLSSITLQVEKVTKQLCA